MGKVITAKRKENEVEQSHTYIKTYILFPSGVMGLLAMVVGIVALVYQLIIDTYDEWTFAKSSLLIFSGIVLGWSQTRYHRYILAKYPGFFASRMKSSAVRRVNRQKKQPVEVQPDHPGRVLMPVLYLLGMAGLIGLSAWCYSSGSLDYMAAFFLPWAGFFWGKLFTWHKVIPPTGPSGKK
ncbi:hypothetical protein [Candidatus Nitronereus thalassa]|uniref:Uncharacterized protein n=1 Tax=Candidatus Nitronereus thalassa TaxID=3020898 RepID=A0ABU3K4J4_9BACT|nr:hypothetical protein [Candidatus Nitronereus thalassa]MDT7041273.1 hypothetical protein [Candidatus Nitronereus thalassa]